MNRFYGITFQDRVRDAVIEAYRRLKENVPLAGCGSESAHGRVLLSLAHSMIKSDKEEIQRAVDFFGLSKPDIAWAIREYVRRVRQAKVAETSVKERIDLHCADIFVTRRNADYRDLNRQRLQSLHRKG